MNKDYYIKLSARIDESQKTITELNTQIKSLQNKISDLEIKVKIPTTTSKGFTDLNTQLQKLGVSMQDFNSNILSTRTTFDTTTTRYTDNAGKMLTVTEKLINGQKMYKASLKEVNSAVETNAKQADTWKYSWSKAFQSFTTYMSVTTVFYQIINTTKQMIQEVTDLDSALVELQKVSTLTGDSLQEFVSDAYDAAEGVAKTGTEMINAATEFSKAGYDDSQILKLGELALMYTNIADEEVSAAESAEFMIAQMKAFNIEAEDAIHIIDAVNEVANRYAVSSADIANNLGKSSAVMANAGNSYEEMIGLLTAGTEITRNASKVSNGLKTITLRMQGMTDEGEKSMELVAQMEELYSKLGISVYDANGELKNTFELLETLAPIYQEATAAEKAYITETIAGKYQAQNAAAILNNFETAINATETAMNSQGSAMSENEKVLGSIRGKLSQLGSQFEELSQKVIGSDLVKFFIDLGTAILKLANSDFGSLVGRIGITITSTLLLTNGFTKLKRVIIDTMNKLTLYNLGLKDTNVSNLKVVASNKALSTGFKLVKTESAGAAIGLNTINSSSKLLTASFGAVTTSIKTMGKAMISNPLFWGVIAIQGIMALVDWMDKLDKSAEEVYEEAKTRYDEVKSELDDVDSQLESISNRMDELKNKGSLSFTEKSELDNLKEQTRQLLLQKQILEEKEKEEKKKLRTAAKNKVSEALGEQTDYTDVRQQVKDTNFIKRFQDQFGLTNKDAFNNKQNLIEFSPNNLKDVESYIDALEQLKKQYSDNKLAVEMLNNEISRVRNNAEATENVEVKVSSSVKKAIDTNKKNYEDYSKKIKENKEQIKKYQEEVKNYEKNNPLVTSGKTPNFQTTEDKEEYLKYQLAKKSIEEMTNENKKYSESQKQSKENLKEQAKVYEELLSDTELQANLSQEELDNLKESLIEIYKITDPNKAKGMQFDEILTSGDYSDAVKQLLDFKDAGEVTGEQIDELREKFPEFDEALGEISSEEAAEHMNSLSEQTQNLAEVMNDATATAYDRLVALADSYSVLTSAVDEYNDSGYITANTLKSLVDNDLLQYLEWENGALVANTGALYDLADAAKISALEDLKAAYAKDVLAIATGDTAEASQAAKDIIAEEKGQISGLGMLAQAQVGGLFSLAMAQEAVASAGKDIDLSDKQAQLEKLNSVYNNMAKTISSMSLGGSVSRKYTGGRSSSSRPSSSSSSSKSEKEWWEKELEALQDQFKYNEITIEQYINGLSNLLGRVQQGTDAWRKINEELQKQRLTKVEDDYKRGTISLDEYIAKLKELIKAYKQGTDAWNELADKIKEGLEDKLDQQKDDLETAEDAAISIIDKEIEKLEDLRDAEEERYDKLIEEKEKANEETEKELELARLQEALENAKKEKNKRVWREGIGWVWEADQEAIKEAQEALDEFNKEQEINDLEEEKDNALDAIDDQIKGWEDYKEQWESVVDDYEFEQDRLILLQKLGAETENEILQQKIEAINRYKDAYLSTMKEIEELEKTSADKLMGYTTPKDTNVGAGSTPGASGGGGSAAPSLSKGSYVSVKPGTRWYSNSYGGGTSGTARSGTIRYVNNSGTHPYNIDGLGWVRKTDIVGYRHGGVVDYTGLAMLHGTKTKPEYVLNNDQMRNMLANFTKPQVTKNVANNTNKVENYNFGNIELPNVNNAQQFVTELKSLINITKHQ